MQQIKECSRQTALHAKYCDVVSDILINNILQKSNAQMRKRSCTKPKAAAVNTCVCNTKI